MARNSHAPTAEQLKYFETLGVTPSGGRICCEQMIQWIEGCLRGTDDRTEYERRRRVLREMELQWVKKRVRDYKAPGVEGEGVHFVNFSHQQRRLLVRWDHGGSQIVDLRYIVLVPEGT